MSISMVAPIVFHFCSFGDDRAYPAWRVPLAGVSVCFVPENGLVIQTKAIEVCTPIKGREKHAMALIW